MRRMRTWLAVLVLVPGILAFTKAGDLLGPTTMGVRARHGHHVTASGLECTTCHEAAPGSTESSDLLLPRSERCLECHPDASCEGPVKPSCKSCHPVKPRSHLTTSFDHAGRTTVDFDHSKHVGPEEDRCLACHPLDPLAPDERNPGYPGMPRCISCHPHDDAWATDTCVPCHVMGKKGTIAFSDGENPTPPPWMKGAAHDGAWVVSHATAAALHSKLCAACHVNADCAACHAGKVKPASIHPGDWIQFHPVTAKTGDLRCSACHGLQDDCITCHRKTGNAWDSPTNLGVPAGNVFHPEGWYSLSGGANKHAKQAKKNLVSCASCHSETSCIVCHAATSLIAASPHPSPGLWHVKCKSLAAKNPTSCLKCHPSVPAACR